MNQENSKEKITTNKKSKVYFCSAKQDRLISEETLPKKLDKVIESLKISERVRNESVAIKMHLGGEVSYSVIHPVFVRRVVQAVLDGGGKPFVTDLPYSCRDAYKRGYTQETLGCPIISASGPDEKYFYKKEYKFKNISEWYIGGTMHDASFLIDLAHVKGHPSCGFGAAMKNIALGGVTGKTRGQLHDSMHFDQYWFPEKCEDNNKMKETVESCPFGGLSQDKTDPHKMYIHFENCNQCKRCISVAPEGSLKIDPKNFAAFQEGCAISVYHTLSSFEKGKTTFINIANQITPVCDCFGFTTPSIIQDIGIFGSDDIIAIEKATLDVIANYKIMTENLPAITEFQENAGHPFQQIHGSYKDPYLMLKYGEELGLGSSDYELLDLMPPQQLKHGERAILYINTK